MACQSAAVIKNLPSLNSTINDGTDPEEHLLTDER